VNLPTEERNNFKMKTMKMPRNEPMVKAHVQGPASPSSYLASKILEDGSSSSLGSVNEMYEDYKNYRKENRK
jgi:hypothetical protein